MASIDDPVWTAVIAAEDAHGEGSEDHARCEAGKACRAGHMHDAAIWDATADDLHSLHSINQTVIRRRAAILPLPRKSVAPDAAAPPA